MEEKKMNQAKQGGGLAVGMMLGALVGILTDNIGLWLPLGMIFGLLGGRSASTKNEQNKEQATEEK